MVPPVGTVSPEAGTVPVPGELPPPQAASRPAAAMTATMPAKPRAHCLRRVTLRQSRAAWGGDPSSCRSSDSR